MIRRPPRSTHCISSAASDVYKRQKLYFISTESSTGCFKKYVTIKLLIIMRKLVLAALGLTGAYVGRFYFRRKIKIEEIQDGFYYYKAKQGYDDQIFERGNSLLKDV
eukprot:TRINITY_DN8044_c0_g1_i4.p2 TRINITY_DN8044_c0_g1~~TRINITY_DN8044_c0_g1_i4.p2  ORF type:complete len:115 (+),score=25.99 TRINITY_DN8044_c0_g1_i4:26-346(+)